MKKDRAIVIERIRARTKPENKQFVQKNLEISRQISALLEEKGWNQKVFAQKLGKQESEVSKILSGLHNITLKSIAKMESVLNKDIITTPLEASKKYKTIEYITFIATINEISEDEIKKSYDQKDIEYKEQPTQKPSAA